MFRQNLEETGMGFDKETEMIRIAHELNLLTAPYVFNTDEATKMIAAGADIIVAHMGLTTSGMIGAKTAGTLDDSVNRVQAIQRAAITANREVIVLCHGGPIATPQDAQYILQNTTGVHGFFGASSVERLPVEEGIKIVTNEFKSLKLRR